MNVFEGECRYKAKRADLVDRSPIAYTKCSMILACVLICADCLVSIRGLASPPLWSVQHFQLGVGRGSLWR
jgi:hypothetical protein